VPDRRLLTAAGTLALLGALPVAASAARVRWLSAGRTHLPADVPHRGVGMVLGARAYPTHPSTFLAARLDVAVELYARGKINAVLVTGDGLPRSFDEPKVMKDYLVAHGVPATAVFEDGAGFDTYDSCIRARDTFGLTELTVISQDYHLPRIIAICRELGIDAVGVPDRTIRRRRGPKWVRGLLREQLANLKMEWDLFTRRRPQREDPLDPTLRDHSLRG